MTADAATDELVGIVGFDRRDAQRPGHLESGTNELELSYAFLPSHWGKGLATEAATLALNWAGLFFDDKIVVACTQAANTPSLRLLRRLGFSEVERFLEFDTEQLLLIKELDRAKLQ